MNAKKQAPKQRKTTKSTKVVAAELAPAPEQSVAAPPQEAAIPARPAEIVCKKCGGANPASASLCRKCGSKLVVSLPTAVMPKQPEAPRVIPAHEVVVSAGSGSIVCKKCGGVNPPDVSLCRRCGSRLAVTAPIAVSYQSASLRCSKCGHQNQAGANFCAKCGAKFEAASRPKFCPRCGDPVARDEIFCDKCGKKLT